MIDDRPFRSRLMAFKILRDERMMQIDQNNNMMVNILLSKRCSNISGVLKWRKDKATPVTKADNMMGVRTEFTRSLPNVDGYLAANNFINPFAIKCVKNANKAKINIVANAADHALDDNI